MLRTVPIALISENPVALRTVDKESEEFLGLVDSIRSRGFLGAITVRARKDDGGKEYFELIDGLHRFTAAKEAGLKEINVDIHDLNEDQMLEAQILANVHKIETKPIEYTEQLKRILLRNPMMTSADLAKRIGKSTSWLDDRLNLQKIRNPEIRKRIDSGEICLMNAYALAKLPEEEQIAFLQQAINEPSVKFGEDVTSRIKEIRAARNEGRKLAPIEFKPVPHLRKLAEIRDESEKHVVGPELIKKFKIAKVEDAFAMAVAWTLNMDPDAQEAQRQEFERRKKEKELAKERARRERAEAAAKASAEAVVKAEEAVKGLE